jgi:hypothetical protein
MFRVLVSESRRRMDSGILLSFDFPFLVLCTLRSIKTSFPRLQIVEHT